MGAKALAVLVQTKPAEVPWRVLLRNTAAVIAPLGLGIATARVSVGLAIAVGAIVTMYSDQPGPYRQRLARLLAVSAAGGLAALIGMLVGGELALLLPATLIVGFLGALLVVFGDAIGRVGMAAMILLTITAAHPAGNAETALQSAALIACGGLLLAGLSIAAWPLQRYGPEREALAAVYHGLAALARRHDVDAGTAPELSDGMTSLQHTLLGPHRARGAVMESFGVLLELAERIRLELTALANSDPGASMGQLLHDEAATVLDDISAAITAAADSERKIARSMQGLRAAEGGLPPGDGAPEAARVRHLHALCGQLAAAARNADRASAVGALHAEQADLQLPRALRPQSSVEILVANLTPRSAAFRHAIRTAICLALAAWVGRLLALSHGYWIPMTVAIVLRADYGATFSYALLRVAGTVVGLLLTTALLHFLPADPWVWLAVMAVLCAGFRYFGPVHYGVAVTALTGMVVLLLALAGEPAEPTMVSRLIATAIGSAMALAAYGSWPTREREQIHTSVARLLHAYAAYLASLGIAGRPHEQREARNGVRVARANAEAALARLSAEPDTSSALVELVQSLLANSNRLARTTMSFDAALSTTATVPAWEPVQALVGHCAAALGRIAEAVGKRVDPESIPPRLRAMQRELAQALGASDDQGVAGELASLSDRLVDNIDTLAHVVARAREASG
ncbi:MAG: FUSC family protein [Steroidobacteraceae bacterium]